MCIRDSLCFVVIRNVKKTQEPCHIVAKNHIYSILKILYKLDFIRNKFHVLPGSSAWLPNWKSFTNIMISCNIQIPMQHSLNSTMMRNKKFQEKKLMSWSAIWSMHFNDFLLHASSTFLSVFNRSLILKEHQFWSA